MDTKHKEAAGKHSGKGNDLSKSKDVKKKQDLFGEMPNSIHFREIKGY
jgi:hypothetical protein